jgi:Asp-tRNA(Asn)/Glu-tRNA(Gln) amidotransferase A subunit family amidase
MAVEAAAFHRLRFAAHRRAYGPMITSLLDEGLTVLGVDYIAALEWQRGFRQEVADLLFHAGVDALIMPSTDTTAPTLEATGTPKFQAPWSCAGLPVTSVPCGLATNGMPAGLQLIASAGQEGRLLGVAQWCERRLAFDELPPILRS